MQSGFISPELTPFDGYMQSTFTLPSGISIIYKQLLVNAGGAGGFFLGQHAAVNDDFDWVWLMDDDGAPSATCLETLLNKANQTAIEILNPMVLNIKDNRKFAFGLSKRITSPEIAEEKADKNGLIHGYANPFNGTLMRTSIIRTLGYIKKEMFIWGDEVEYFERIKNKKIPFATAIDAIFFHPKNKSETERMFGKIRIVKKPKHLEMNFYRNKAYIFRKHKKSTGFLFVLKYVVYFTINKEYSRLWNFIRYYADGWTGKYKLPGI